MKLVLPSLPYLVWALVWCFANVHSCTFRGPLFLSIPTRSLANTKHSGKEECKKERTKKMSPHKVQIKLCCVPYFFFFFFFPPPFPSDVFITKPNVCSESAKSSQERESLKQNVKVTSLNQVSAALRASRLDWSSVAYEPHFPSVQAVSLRGLSLLLAKC